MQRKLHLRLPSNSLRHVARVTLGTTIQKKFGREGTLVGTLVSFDEVQDLYRIRYDGDDVEELSWVDFLSYSYVLLINNLYFLINIICCVL